MKFLRSRYLLSLILTILLIEGAFRLGFYEPFVNPASHAGTTITLLKALRQFGLDEVEVVTFGDSRAGQGLDNQAILAASQRFGLDHVRMSMPGSRLLTFGALAGWSLEELPALRGVMLALGMASFDPLRQGPFELAKVLPIRDHTSARDMLFHVPFVRADVRTYAPFSTLAGYRQDIRELLARPLQRRTAVMQRDASPQDFLYYSAGNTEDICAVATTGVQACLADLKSRHDEIRPRARPTLRSLCRHIGITVKDTVPGPKEEQFAAKWISLLETLADRLEVMVVLLPDHSIYRETRYATHATRVMERVAGVLRGQDAIELVDLRGLVEAQQDPECGFFMDAKHLNHAGNQLLTRALLAELEKFWARLEVPGESGSIE